MKNQKSKTVILAECAVMVGLAFVLSYVRIFTMPMEGSVTLLSMLPIVILSVAIFAHIDGTLGISPPHLTSMLIKCAIFPVLLQAFQIIFSYFLRAERPVCPSAPFR